MPRNGTPARDALEQRFAHAELVERAHHLAEVADAGQDDLRGALRRPAASRTSSYSRADLVQRVLDRPQIAGAVIEDGDHSSPLVEGSWSFSRASFEQAYFMARAKHLKIASILWWFERPYSTFACRLAPA